MPQRTCPECGEPKAAHKFGPHEQYRAVVEDCGNAEHPPQRWYLTLFDDGEVRYPILRSMRDSEHRWKKCCVTSGTAYVEEFLTYGKCDATWRVVREDPACTVERIIFTDNT